jgi:hypothetical protein
MERSAVFAELDALIGAAAPEERPAIALALSARLAAVAAGMTVAVSDHADDYVPVPERLLTPAEAAAIPGVPVSRIYTWARGAKWARRPSRRCLRIDEVGFRRWLAARR